MVSIAFLMGEIFLDKTLKYSFLQSVPVLLGYVFLGMAFGILLQQAGYGVIWAFFISLTVYAGSMQFVLVSFLREGTPLGVVAAMTLLINSRHLFYGISFVDKFKRMGRKYFYMIFSLTDETYSLLCALDVPDGVDEKKASYLISAMNQSYWVTGSVIGAIAGQLIPFDFTGIDFSMTALFTVIFIEQWMGYKSHFPAIAGIISSIFFLIVLGPDRFILPSLIATVFMLMAGKKKVMHAMEGGKR